MITLFESVKTGKVEALLSVKKEELKAGVSRHNTKHVFCRVKILEKDNERCRWRQCCPLGCTAWPLEYNTKTI